MRDVAAANVAALEAAGPPEGALGVYNTGSGEPHTVGEMATALAAAHGGPEPVVTGEYRLGRRPPHHRRLDPAAHRPGLAAPWWGSPRACGSSRGRACGGA
ncbi:hypothetical protein STENM223S_02324 [Streptomyces tendae]